MATDTVTHFESMLDAHHVECTRVPVAELAETLSAIVEPPAVGTPLGIDGLSLESLGVETAPTAGQLEAAATGVARAGAGIAEYGTIVVQSDAAGTEPVSLYPPLHVPVLRASDVLPDVRSGLEWLSTEFDAGRDSAVLATGPSATADMGGLVFGAHGPERVHVVVLTDR